MSDTLWVLDFDRCLGDVDTLYGYLEEIITSQYAIPLETLARGRREVEQTGGSFDALSFCKKLLSDEQYSTLVATYRSAKDLRKSSSEEDDFLLPGARMFLDWLNTTGRPYVIMTFGSNDWQVSKLTRSGLSDVPYMIVNSRHKARLINDWLGDEGRVNIPINKVVGGGGLPVTVRQVVLVDDKIQAFDSLDSAFIRGYVLCHMSKDGIRNDSFLPGGVSAVSSFSEIIEGERQAA